MSKSEAFLLHFAKTTLLFSIALISTLAQASEISDLVNQAQEKEAYEYVRSNCGSVGMTISYFALNSGSAALDKIKALKYYAVGEYDRVRDPEIPTLNQAKFEDELNSRGLSPKINGFLQTRGYYQALAECFPGSEISRNLYTFFLITSDVVGTGVDLASVTVLARFGTIPALRVARGTVALPFRVTRGVGRLSSSALLRLGFSKSTIAKLAGAIWGISLWETGKTFLEQWGDFKKKWNDRSKEQRDELEAQLTDVADKKDQYNTSCYFKIVDPRPDVLEAYQKNKIFYSQTLKNTIEDFGTELSGREVTMLEKELKAVASDSVDCVQNTLENHPEFEEQVNP